MEYGKPAAGRRGAVDCEGTKYTRRRALGLATGLSLAATWECLGMSAVRARQQTRQGTGSLSYRDGRLPSGIPSREWQIYRARENPNSRIHYGYRHDPKYRREYPYRLQVAALEETGARRTFVIHYQHPQDESLAWQNGHVLARLYWISRDYLGLQPVADHFTAVFLARGGQAGGEEANGHIYLHAVEEARAAAEWVRELAHEYGHVVLPPVGEFREPEKWANGYLGERLLMKWLLHDNGAADIWTEPIDGAAYVTRQVEPLRTLFCREGPASRSARARDAAGMNFWIGQVLAVESLYGPALLREVLTALKSTEPEALTPALAAALRSRRARGIEINPETFIPDRTERVSGEAAEIRVRRAAYRLFLPAGTWRLSLNGAMPPGTMVTLNGGALGDGARDGGRQAISWPALSPADGWHLLEMRSPTDRPLTLQSLALAGD